MSKKFVCFFKERGKEYTKHPQKYIITTTQEDVPKDLIQGPSIGA